MAKAVLLLLALLPFSSSLALNQDFCVADLPRGDTPAGYPCKPQTDVTADDFYYRGLGTTGPTINPFSIGLSSAFIRHPLLFVIEGTVSAGFISSLTNKVFTKTLYKGDLMAFPQGLLHFQYNLGNDTAVALSSYSSANPGLMILDFALFANDLPSDVVSKVTVLDELEVRKLKALFGGSG
ncbi:unnamed protein product [Urochloa decumbens]|uniref:Germin-like protein n=1 Tax=Urochloa decumbens TaxID=240449 RepID=A0ABC9BHU2_9POAL